ncbi:MAG TPA: aminotransferase class III-fold pyridoxal phosphate-dependent enzyme [Planctomycetota bacterium]|nr:aminotransferase class III-fold pyridoxal phosphate-dependent enzyme [Planctomycetota bacterium]
MPIEIQSSPVLTSPLATPPATPASFIAGPQPRLLSRLRDSGTSASETFARAQSVLEREFICRCPRSTQLYARAVRVFPGGVTHDNRRVLGHSLYLSKARGARKTDVDGNSYIDYWVGHGALLLGHGAQEVVEAVSLAAQEIMHPGGCHEREVLWGELVRQMVPSAERVRFTASGSEATALAVRLARAATGKSVILKFEGHFHGWLDHAVNGVDLPFERPFSSGVPDPIRGQTLVLPPRDLNLVEEALKTRGDIAGIILEPTGASGGTVPVKPEFLDGLREMATRYRVALIFDEVITGFRLAPGGAQERFGVKPDLTCLAKILAGGMPGGAVCGSKAFFSKMEFSTDAKHDRAHRVTQYGTFNGNPVSAAAGIAALQGVKRMDGSAGRRAENFTETLRNALNTLFRLLDTPWAAYGTGSVFHLLISDRDAAIALRDRQANPANIAPQILKQKSPLDGLLRRALLLQGIDLPQGRQAWTSAEHGQAEIRETMEAFGLAIERLKALRCL